MKLYSVFNLLTLTLSVKAFTWTPCDVDKVPFTPDVVQLVPDPPAAGGQVTFKISGNAGKGMQRMPTSSFQQPSNGTKVASCTCMAGL